MWVCFLAGIPIGSLATFLLGGHAGWVVFPWAAVWAVLVVRHWVSPCPRCGHFFCWGRFGPSYWAQSCRHCGLPLRPPSAEGDVLRNRAAGVEPE